MNTSSPSHVIDSFRVRGLFGYATRDIELRHDTPTVLTGSNGSGKTQTLRILEALVTLDLSALVELPFVSTELTTSDDVVVRCTKNYDDESDQHLAFYLSRPASGLVLNEKVSDHEIQEIESRQLPRLARIDRVGPNSYTERSSGQRLTSSQLRARYPQLARLSQPAPRTGRSSHILATLPERIANLASEWPRIPCLFIDTKRLDDTRVDSLSPSAHRASATLNRTVAASRIEGYLELIHNQMLIARQDSLMENQASDSSFAARALDAAHDAIKELSLRESYQRLVQRSEALASNGMHAGSAPPELRESKLNPTEKRILSVFLDDWERRLAPLEPVNKKIELFRTLLDERLSASYKGTVSTPKGVKIVDSYGDEVTLSKLSSGEQHIIALFTRLLFNSRRGSLVLIDEPEISLHPAWQHQFIDDLEKISTEISFQTVIATHSPAIVNGRWDLEESLQLPRPPRQDPHAQAAENEITEDAYVSADSTDISDLDHE